MASTAKGRAGVTEEATEVWWLRFNNGVPADDGDDADGGVGKEEEDGEDAALAAAGDKVEMVVGDGRARSVVAGDEEVEMEMEPSDGRAAVAAMGVQAGVVARGGGKTETGAAGAGGKRRSSPRFADRALVEKISEANYVLPGELPRRRRKAIAKRSKLQVDGVEVQNDMAQVQCLHPVFKGSERFYEENEVLKLQLALKTTELKQEENRRLKLELILKTKEIESLQKQNEELKSENEELKKSAKPPRTPRLCRSCNKHVMHDYRNCPKRRQAASSPEEEEEEDYRN